MSKKEIVIFGVSEISELAHFYFETDSEYKVVAFTVDREFKKADSFKGLPIIAFEDIEILRFLELNTKIKMIKINNQNLAVDVKEDIIKVENFILKSF